MKHGLYLIRDSALDAFLLPNYFTSQGAARRAFGDAVNKVEAGNMLNTHPEHFQLFYAGTFDDDTGLFECFVPSLVVDAKSVLVV